MAQILTMVTQVPEYIKSFRRERLSSLRPLNEFFDYQRISRPQDSNEAFQRITYNTRYFSGNYAVIVGALAVYGLLTSPWLLVAIAFLVGGFALINRFAPEPMQVGEHVVTQKSLYTVLFVIGIPLLWYASPIALLFWLIGSSAFVILGHAAFIEPPVASEYSTVETV
ncbi:Prenylated Rab acceptor 1 [Tilletia horrida]|uniref:PRA1 family protein n=1 Tax=Tilletia horrida TaxID=155126 RepID=A0AAN6GJW1_9BASI|nr:Prenylated Rab acceptor 1 [Tilletia horrida]KAK0540553.1 Prenylated Rab acceptor 1 [Tilletia horrida]KAK0541194.1 Prenylated Rab acceptor 1 [Tilletia horrida]KAK0554548.1 Prenylated Rab acceptor 1 [Tilletia horrida]